MKLGALILAGVFSLIFPMDLAMDLPSEKPPPRGRRFKITFYCNCGICTKQYSPERGGKGLTRLGHHPVPFRTAATGDPKLLGKWVFFEDLGHWLHINDTGKLEKNQLDIYVGGSPMHKAALCLGVMEWEGTIR